MSDISSPLSGRNVTVDNPDVLSLPEYLISESYLIKPDNQKCPTNQELRTMFSQTTRILNSTTAWPFSSTVTVLHLPHANIQEIDDRIPFFLSPQWETEAKNCIKKTAIVEELQEGENVLTFYGMSPGIILEKIIIHKEDVKLPYSYLGPIESYRAG